MKITSYYPVIAVEDVAKTSAFYKDLFGFTAAFESDWYVHLSDEQNESVNLAILQAGHETIPEGARAVAQGMLLNFEVEDVDALWEKFSSKDLDILLPIRDEEFGQRHFIIRDPNGIMIDLIKPIPPNAAFAEQYSETALPH